MSGAPLVGDAATDAGAVRAAKVSLIPVSFGYAETSARELSPDIDRPLRRVAGCSRAPARRLRALSPQAMRPTLRDQGRATPEFDSEKPAAESSPAELLVNLFVLGQLCGLLIDFAKGRPLDARRCAIGTFRIFFRY